MPYTHLYSVHPYWWKRQVLHQTWPSGSQHSSKKECRQDIYSGFETHEEGHTKSKTGAISGSTKWTLVQTKNLKKKEKKSTFAKIRGPQKIKVFSMKEQSVVDEAWGVLGGQITGLHDGTIFGGCNTIEGVLGTIGKKITFFSTFVMPQRVLGIHQFDQESVHRCSLVCSTYLDVDF